MPQPHREIAWAIARHDAHLIDQLDALRARYAGAPLVAVGLLMAINLIRGQPLPEVQMAQPSRWPALDIDLSQPGELAA